MPGLPSWAGYMISMLSLQKAMNKVLSTVFSNGLEKLGRLLAREKPRQDRRTGTGNSKQRIGARGEDQAVRGLKKQGLKIVEQNFRCKTGEIDIIAKDGNTLVFVEVKTRRTPLFRVPQGGHHPDQAGKTDPHRAVLSQGHKQAQNQIPV